jgi:hypothetical protein
MFCKSFYENNIQTFNNQGAGAMNNSGKTLTIFLLVIAVLLISLTAIAVFFFLKEVDLRKSAEYNLEQMRVVESKLQGELKETKRQLFLQEEKSKEAEDKVESLMEEIDLEKGLREEVKKENRQLQENLDKESKAKDQLREQMTKDLTEAEKKVTTLQDQLNAAISEKQKSDAAHRELIKKYQELQQKLGINEPLPETLIPETSAPETPKEVPSLSEQPQAKEPEVSLDKIVVNPAPEDGGKVISIDAETEFLIVNLGEKDGVRKNTVLSIYRGEKYLGDVKVTRVLPEMSAADFVPPFSSKDAQKDDRVVLKQ